MTNGNDPWESIQTSSINSGRIERRVDPTHPIDFYRARLADGRYLFLLKGLQEFQAKRFPALGGIKISLEESPEQSFELILELTEIEQVSLFRALSNDLIVATNDLAAGESDLAATRLMTRLERWQVMFRERRDKKLSRPEIIGLTGELLFLHEKLLPLVGIDLAIRAWRGPHGDEQDFALGDYVVEIKTQLSTADQHLFISSEAQLDDSSGKVVICHQTIVSSSADEKNTWTLNQLVEELRTIFMSHSLISLDLFDAGLLGVGYQTRVEYDEETWKPVKTRLFEVVDDFPRLVPTNLPPGVSNVSYRISLGNCEQFERAEKWLNGAIVDPS